MNRTEIDLSGLDVPSDITTCSAELLAHSSPNVYNDYHSLVHLSSASHAPSRHTVVHLSPDTIEHCTSLHGEAAHELCWTRIMET